MNAARALREARRRAGLSQRELASRAGVAQPAIARIEQGKTIPRVDTLDKLLEACSEGLYAEPRRGIGVDKTLMAKERSLSPSTRLYRAVEWANWAHGTRTKARVPAVVREGFRPPVNPTPILEVLIAHEVSFIVVGGVAGNVHALARPTYDLDVVYSRETENIARLVGALKELGSSLRGAPAGLPDVIDDRFITNGMNFTFETIYGDLDCLGEPAGTRGYADLLANATEEDVWGLSVRVASISDVIRMKKAAGRTKDLSDIEFLSALQEVIDDEERRKRGR